MYMYTHWGIASYYQQDPTFRLFVRYVQQLVMRGIPTTTEDNRLRTRIREMRFVYTLVDDYQEIFVCTNVDEVLQLLFCRPLLVLWHLLRFELEEKMSLQGTEFRLLALYTKKHCHNNCMHCVQLTNPIHAIPSLNRWGSSSLLRNTATVVDVLPLPPKNINVRFEEKWSENYHEPIPKAEM